MTSIPSFNQFVNEASLRGLKFTRGKSTDDNGLTDLSAKVTPEQALTIVAALGLGFWSGNTKHEEFKDYIADPDGNDVLFGEAGHVFVAANKGEYTVVVPDGRPNRSEEIDKLERMTGKLPADDRSASE